MSISIFLDSNQFIKDYYLNKAEYEEFFYHLENNINEENVYLFITTTIKQEILKNYAYNIDDFKKNLISIQKFNMLYPDENIIDLDINPQEMLTDYVKFIDQTFNILEISNKIIENATNRLFRAKMPFYKTKNFQDPFDKKAFNDALIFETILDYSNKTREIDTIFVSSNTKDFATKEEALHPDYGNNITYCKNIRDVMKHLDILKEDHFNVLYPPEEKHHIFETIYREIEPYLIENFNKYDELYDFLEHYFNSNNFTSDFIEGWGTDIDIKKFNKIELSEDETILYSKNLIYCTVHIDVEMTYYVETSNPVYEKGYPFPEQFIRSDEHSRNLDIDVQIIFDREAEKIVGIERIELI